MMSIEELKEAIEKANTHARKWQDLCRKYERELVNRQCEELLKSGLLKKVTYTFTGYKRVEINDRETCYDIIEIIAPHAFGEFNVHLTEHINICGNSDDGWIVLCADEEEHLVTFLAEQGMTAERWETLKAIVDLKNQIRVLQQQIADLDQLI